MKFIKINILVILIFLSFGLQAQQYGLGGSLQFNPQTESFGAGIRASINPNNMLSIVPQISYYPGFNKVNELHLGLGVDLKIIRKNKFYIYLLAHGGYNSWFNYLDSPMEDAKKHNWNLEGGAGISTWGCWRPFIEYRYNAKFMETNLQLGVLYIFNCKGSGKRTQSKSRKFSIFSRKQNCPAYGTKY